MCKRVFVLNKGQSVYDGDFKTLIKSINPKIVSCSITGFGETGPHSSRPAYDQIVQAYSGGMSITGPDANTPTRAGIPIGDLSSGLYSVIGILSALLSKEKTGKGQNVDISLLDVQISLLTYMATMQTLSGKDPEPIGNAHFVHVPYNTFTAKDGFIVIAVITNSFWDSLLEVVNIKELRNSEFRDQPGRLANQEYIENELNNKLIKKSSSYWINKLNKAKVPCGPINTFSQALADEQVSYRNMVVEVPHPDGGLVKMPGNPVKLSYTGETTYSPPPHLGQDTRKILETWAGYDASKIEALITSKVVQAAD